MCAKILFGFWKKRSTVSSVYSLTCGKSKRKKPKAWKKPKHENPKNRRTLENIAAVAEIVREVSSTAMHCLSQQLYNWTGYVERILVHKNWRGGYWQHLVSKGWRYPPHRPSYSRCFAMMLSVADSQRCDLTPLDYYLSDVVKNKCYVDKPWCA